MGTEVHCKSYLPGYYSMRNLNEDVDSGSWPLYYGEKTFTNGQYYNGFMPRTVADAYLDDDKVALKHKILEHDAIFKNQVYELHRLYRIQRDMMEEIKKMKQHTYQISTETLSGSSLETSQMPFEDAWKWHISSFPLTNSSYASPSILGANVFTSPLSCTKGNDTQADRVPLQSGFNSKDCEVLESRPSKVRKKLFDLRLPADEYIDTEEGEQVLENISDTSSHPLNRNHEITCGDNVKLFFGGCGRTNYRGDASASDSCLRSSIGLADLNEPIQVEEGTVLTCVDFLGRSASRGDIGGPDLSAKPKSEILGLSKELLRNSYHGSNSGTLNNLSVEDKGNERGWSSKTYEAGKNKISPTSIRQYLQQDRLPIPSHPMQVMLNTAHQPLGVFSTSHSSKDQWRDTTARGFGISDRNHDPSNYRCLESVMASQKPNPYPFVNSLDPVNSGSPSVSSWGKPISHLSQKSTPVHTIPSLNSSATLSSCCQSSDQIHDIDGDKWNVNGSYRSNPGMQSDLPNRNGFYHGSSLRSKKPSFPSDRSINHVSEELFKVSNFMDLRSARDMNLNVVLTKSSSNEAVSQQEIEIVDETKKYEDRLAVLPWLRAKPSCKNAATDTHTDSTSVNLDVFQDSSNSLLCKKETVKDLNQIFSENVTSALTDGYIEAKKDNSETLTKRKIMGFPIFEYPCASKNESSSQVSTSASFRCPPEVEIMQNEEKNRVIDLNLASDPSLPDSGKPTAAGAVIVAKAMDIELTSLRSRIDLNSCLTEYEDLLAPSVASTSSNLKITVEIDLETPFVLETEEDILPEEEQKQHHASLKSPEHKAEQPQDEVVRIAAGAIVAISSSDQHKHKEDAASPPSEASLAESLLWFSDVVSSHANDLENKFGKEMRGRDGGDVEDSSADEIDYFEAMTLQLTETKKEDYMPKLFVPEVQKVEETAVTSSLNRHRRCARRGRQRRDFQRDILPGIASLSRHEVTEDLQAFGGLMKASGHSWNSGSSRRNGTRTGAARGRQRSVVETVPSIALSPVRTPLIEQLNNIEAGLNDRSLKGWGKTPRRPRRKRCPAGNPLPVVLT